MTWRWTSPRGQSAGSSARTGPARPPRSACCSAWSARPSGSGTILGGSLAEPASYLHKVGALIESPAFYPQLSGRENLKALARLGRLPLTAVDPVLERSGLLARAGDKYRSYSLGMKQRLGIAAAMLAGPELLILDEPTNGLDPAGIVEMRGLIRSFAEDGITVLVSSHLISEIEQICDYVVMIRAGRLVHQGPRHRVAGHPAGGVPRSRRSTTRTSSVLIKAAAAGRLHGDRGHGRRRAGRRAPGASAADLNRHAAQHGITLRQLGERTRSLERAFFALTGTKSADVPDGQEMGAIDDDDLGGLHQRVDQARRKTLFLSTFLGLAAAASLFVVLMFSQATNNGGIVTLHQLARPNGLVIGVARASMLLGVVAFGIAAVAARERVQPRHAPPAAGPPAAPRHPAGREDARRDHLPGARALLRRRDRADRRGGGRAEPAASPTTRGSPGPAWPTCSSELGDLALATVGYSVLGMAVGQFVRSAVFAVIIGFAWLIAVENIIVRIVPGMQQWMPGASIVAVASGGNEGVGYGHGLFLGAVYVVAAIAASMIVFLRSDVTA